MLRPVTLKLCLILALVPLWAWFSTGSTETDAIGTRLMSSAVYPPHGLEVQFDHLEHSERYRCEQCHGGLDEGGRVRAIRIPTMEECGQCHPEAGDTVGPGACGSCHRGYEPIWPEGAGWLGVRDPRFPLLRPRASTRLEANLEFRHEAHEKNPCDACHRSSGASDVSLPLMDHCLDCHASTGASTRCATCHPTRPDGRLRTRFPGNQARSALLLRPQDHDGDWSDDHRSALMADPVRCFNCHDERDCLACHDPMAGQPAYHPAGYVRHHGQTARTANSSCASCHRVDAFCQNCHIDVGLTGEENHRPPVYHRLHPERWSGVGGGEHREAAQRNISECASCHQEEDCARCHRVVSPHGGHFDSRCASLLEANDRVCLRCHGAADIERLRSLCR